MIMSSANIYFLFSPDALYLFFLCNCFPGASNTLLGGNGGSRHLCHVPDPWEKGFGLSAFIMYVCYSRAFHWCPLSDWGNPLFPPGLLSISVKGVDFCQCFLYINGEFFFSAFCEHGVWYWLIPLYFLSQKRSWENGCHVDISPNTNSIFPTHLKYRKILLREIFLLIRRYTDIRLLSVEL